MVGTPAPGGSPYGQQVSLSVGFSRIQQNLSYPLSQSMCQEYFFPLTMCSVLFQVGVLGPPGQQAPPPYPGPHPAGPPVIQQPTTPMFVAPPPKTQRLLHSEAYLKYIEGLSAESNSISKWDQTLAGKDSPSQQTFVKSHCCWHISILHCGMHSRFYYRRKINSVFNRRIWSFLVY